MVSRTRSKEMIEAGQGGDMVDKLDSIMSLSSLVSYQDVKESFLEVPKAMDGLPVPTLDLMNRISGTISSTLSPLPTGPLTNLLSKIMPNRKLASEFTEAMWTGNDISSGGDFKPFSPIRRPTFDAFDDDDLAVSDGDDSKAASEKASDEKDEKGEAKAELKKKEPVVDFAAAKEEEETAPTKTELLGELLRRTTRPMFTTRVIIVHTLHIFILAYFLGNCGKGETESTFPWHNTICGATEVGWGSDTSFPPLDRFLHLDLGIFFILLNVIPKYIKRDLAKRHQHNVVKRLRINPLLVHVIFGILTVVISGVVSWTEWYNRFTMFLVLFADLGHQFSIYRLLKNHDGIWQLRVGNLALGVAKWICALRIVFLGDWVGPTNVIFIHSMGFGLTRLFCFICAFVVSNINESMLAKEHWYSVGLSGAQFYCGYRNQGTYPDVFWVCCIISSVLYYGKNLDRMYQSHLFGLSVLLTGVAKFVLPAYLQIPFIVLFYQTGYYMPILHRTRANETNLTPTTPEINWEQGLRQSFKKLIHLDESELKKEE